jgi:hypothetical protein
MPQNFRSQDAPVQWHYAGMTLLGPSLHSLQLKDIQRFLDDAESEPLLWEAKGTELDSHAVRKAVCGFANGIETGYLILDAEWDGSAWTLPGIEFPDEPPVWIGSVIHAGLRPVPSVDVRPLRCDGKRKVAVVEVQPVATPPCVSRGTVYERISGGTVPVKDPARLADLYARGRDALARAETNSRYRAQQLIEQASAYPGYDVKFVRFALALSAAGHPPTSARAFSPRPTSNR